MVIEDKCYWNSRFLFITMGPGSASSNADQFLTDVTKGDFEKAFDYVYFFNNAYDEDVTISYEDAQKNWVNRVKKLKEEGTYIKSFQDLDIYSDDGWHRGYVILTVVENGKEQIYDNVNIAFSKKEGKWKVGILDTNEQGSIDRPWEIAYRGYVGK